jgi:hypothetical protein
VILIPTLRYYNFYDFGVVFFSASLAFFALGTVNHQIVLLLVPIYLDLQFSQGVKRVATWGRVALQLAV